MLTHINFNVKAAAFRWLAIRCTLHPRGILRARKVVIMGTGGQNAKYINWGWSRFFAVEAEEVITPQGALRCPYCGEEDRYHVAFYAEQDQLDHLHITEGIKLTCCGHKIALLSKS